MKHGFLTRLLILLTVICLILPLAACSPYRLELSNEKQSAIVMRAGGYDIAFEVVDFFYHNYKSVIDGGDSSVWESEDAALYHEKLLARAIESACELYAILEVSKDFGVDPYGEGIEEQMEEGIRAVIDSYKTRREYIEHLTSLHMTDTVYRLMMRTYLCQQYLLEYTDGVSSVKDEDLLAFCENENVLNTLCLTVYFEKSTLPWAKERAAQITAALADVTTDDGFRQVALQLATAYNSKEMETGVYMTLREYRRLCGDENATLAIGEMTAPIFGTDSFVVLRAIEKDPAILEKNPEAVRSCYLEYLIEEKTAVFAEGREMTEIGLALTPDYFD